jgi:hypothetical protein
LLYTGCPNIARFATLPDLPLRQRRNTTTDLPGDVRLKVKPSDVDGNPDKMSKMLSSSVTAAIAAGRPSLVPFHGAISSAVHPPRSISRPVQLVQSQRVRLDVTLPVLAHDTVHDQVHDLLHCGLGAYIADIDVGERKICVEFNLAHDDIDFAFHTLIAKLPEAIIGPLRPRDPAAVTDLARRIGPRSSS